MSCWLWTTRPGRVVGFITALSDGVLSAYMKEPEQLQPGEDAMRGNVGCDGSMLSWRHGAGWEMSRERIPEAEPEE